MGSLRKRLGLTRKKKDEGNEVSGPIPQSPAPASLSSAPEESWSSAENVPVPDPQETLEGKVESTTPQEEDVEALAETAEFAGDVAEELGPPEFVGDAAEELDPPEYVVHAQTVLFGIGGLLAMVAVLGVMLMKSGLWGVWHWVLIGFVGGLGLSFEYNRNARRKMEAGMLVGWAR